MQTLTDKTAINAIYSNCTFSTTTRMDWEKQERLKGNNYHDDDEAPIFELFRTLLLFYHPNAKSFSMDLFMNSLRFTYWIDEKVYVHCVWADTGLVLEGSELPSREFGERFERQLKMYLNSTDPWVSKPVVYRTVAFKFE
jgi:hypothetical protein